MFRGTEYRNLDDKGRVAIPPRFRDLLVGDEGDHRIMVTQAVGQGGRCLDIYSMAKWKAFEEKVLAMPQFQAKTEAFIAAYIHPAQELTIDSQGRVLLAQDLRKHLGEGRELVFTGHLAHLLLWTEAEYREARPRILAQVSNEDFFKDFSVQ